MNDVISLPNIPTFIYAQNLPKRPGIPAGPFPLFVEINANDHTGRTVGHTLPKE